MGKKQHAKDRMYLTAKEWKEEWGGHKAAIEGTPFKRLPFHCCAIAFTPFEDAVCTEDGTVFDILNIVPYIQKFHRHPVTGALSLSCATAAQFPNCALAWCCGTLTAAGYGVADG